MQATIRKLVNDDKLLELLAYASIHDCEHIVLVVSASKNCIVAVILHLLIPIESIEFSLPEILDIKYVLACPTNEPCREYLEKIPVDDVEYVYRDGSLVLVVVSEEGYAADMLSNYCDKLKGGLQYYCVENYYDLPHIVYRVLHGGITT
ncbi:hypothetical protein [Hyperthermus butylicus]|uniref:Uncharacterized protein n=1 Tax=Hyperthermus butylicus (strain DSM 5456 / JCM 9403 / PLM1-5) TaxID=415426 RepID=A2BMA1_HYPBU|nr:hypothetical protein [Hyperthermus butylicus]ABM81112.1 hypothetical protein Hbut_1282 [Hyperthermus butylicus DSM 5456]